MAYRIEPDLCVACGACADACPQQTIHPKGAIYVIQAANCIDCGACESQCGSGAVKPGDGS